MIPPDEARRSELVEALRGAPLWLAGMWIGFRIIGSSVLVPIIEELAFRGGLFRLGAHSFFAIRMET
jgi:membrane protease YdiL (CAAX protease family)